MKFFISPPFFLILLSLSIISQLNRLFPASIMAFLSLFTIACTPNNTHAKVNLTERIEHYEIFPKKITDLKSEMAKRTPIVIGNRRGFSYTLSKVDWRYKAKKKNNRCSIASVTVDLDITYTMPMLDERKTSEKIIRAFTGYYNDALNHEKYHGQIAKNAAKDIEDMLLALVDYEKCSDLHDDAKKQANNRIKEMQNQNKRFDKNTGHGKTQGVDINSFMYSDQNK